MQCSLLSDCWQCNMQNKAKTKIQCTHYSMQYDIAILDFLYSASPSHLWFLFHIFQLFHSQKKQGISTLLFSFLYSPALPPLLYSPALLCTHFPLHTSHFSLSSKCPISIIGITCFTNQQMF